MEEKIYKTMAGSGALNIVFGVISIVVGIAGGVLLIISGAKLLAGKSERGIMSTVLGILSDVSIGLAVFSSFRIGGRASARLGTVVLVAMLFSIAGLVFGILSRMEKDKFYFFPDLGILLNGIGVCATGFILYAGVFGL